MNLRHYLIYHSPIWLGTPLIAWLLSTLIIGTLIHPLIVGFTMAGLFMLLVVAPSTIDLVRKAKKK